MEYWFNEKGRELDLGKWKTADYWGKEEPSGEHNAAFIYELDSNGGRGVFFLVVVIVHVGETCTPIFMKSPGVSFFLCFFRFLLLLLYF